MGQLQPHTFTRLLLKWRDGDQSALEELLPLAYEELYKRARRYMGRERPGHVLQATALINEVYLRLIRGRQLNWESRSDFFAVCANLMRQILVEMAKSANASINGGGPDRQVSLDEALEIQQGKSVDLVEMVALDCALQKLAELNPRQSRVVELRYFGGLTTEEVANALKVSPETIKRDWRLAKVWLLRELSRKENNDA